MASPWTWWVQGGQVGSWGPLPSLWAGRCCFFRFTPCLFGSRPRLRTKYLSGGSEAGVLGAGSHVVGGGMSEGAPAALSPPHMG